MENIITETSTIHQLKSTVNVFFDTPRDQNSRLVEVFNLSFIPYVDDNQLLVKANTRSKTNTYKTSILFNDVKYVKKDTRYAVEFLANNDKYYIYPIKKNRSDVLVSCTCLDFYYMFSVWNQKDLSLYGEPPEPYIKKTNRPLRNPDKQPGVCKHILRLSDEIIGKRILK
jgi:hypothetical protein